MSAPSPSEHRFGSERMESEEPRLIDQITDQGRFGQGPAAVERGRHLVEAFVCEFIDGAMTLGRDVETMLNARIAQIDHLLSIQVNEILHHPAFQELESAWRGLSYVIRTTAALDGVKVRVLNVTKRELLRDFASANRLRRPAFSTKVLDESLNALGAEPFSVLVGNYSFGLDPQDQELLSEIARVGAAAHAPFLTAPAPEVFTSFSGIPRGKALKRLFASLEYSRWRAFRRLEYSKYAVLALPRILLRKPHFRHHPIDSDEFDHQENVDGYDNAKMLWGNPAWALAAQLACAFGRGSWCADLASREDGGVVRRLASFHVFEDEGDTARKGPTEAPVSDELYTDLCDLGFAPVCRDETAVRAVLFELPTAHEPEPVEDEDGEKHAAAPTMLRDVLVASRVAQYIKCMVREKRAFLQTPAACERYLNKWAARYTVPEGARSNPRDSPHPFIQADFKVVKDEANSAGFRVLGEVLPNLGNGHIGIPVPISVPVLLQRSAFAEPDGGPAALSPFARTMVQDRLLNQPVQEDITAGEAGALRRATNSEADSFSSACDALERLAHLKGKHILDESEFLDLKNGILARMRALTAPDQAIRDKNAREPQPPDYVVPYAQLHNHIVDLIAAPYRAGENAKRRAQRAVAAMAAQRALNPGDAELLNELIEVVLREGKDNDPETSDSFAERLDLVSSVTGKVPQNSSPATKAIAETAKQSGARAFDEYSKQRKVLGATNNFAEKIWRKLVWPDVEGAFSGGAAAASAFATVASPQFPLTAPIAAAFGVVIGAGIRSGIAYGQTAEPDNTQVQVSNSEA